MNATEGLAVLRARWRRCCARQDVSDDLDGQVLAAADEVLDGAIRTLPPEVLARLGRIPGQR